MLPDDDKTPPAGSKILPTAKPLLLVEDDADARELLGAQLRKAGYAVTEASNGRIALDLLLSMIPAPFVVILDLQMPVMDGWQLTAIMRSYHRLLMIPIVVVSAADVSPEARRLFHSFFSKPCDPPALLGTIARIAAYQESE